MTKNISISDQAYERLSRIKGNSSFSQTIMKITENSAREKLLGLINSWKPDEELARNIEQVYKRRKYATLRQADL